MNINIDFLQPDNAQIKNLPPTFYQGKYLGWYCEALKRSTKFRAEIKKLEFSQENMQRVHGELLYRQLLQEYDHYKIAINEKTGNCGNLARAGMYFILAATDYEGSIHRIQGVNVDHAFILINCKTPPAGEFKLEDLPNDAIIIDPWMRCKFTAEHASAYYNDNMSALRTVEGKQGPLIFEVGESISQEQIALAREYVKTLDKNIEQKLSSTSMRNL